MMIRKRGSPGHRTRRATMAVAAMCVGMIGGCATPLKGPQLGGIYNRAAQAHGPWRNPVIVIPGILGSKLMNSDGTMVWGAFSGGYANPETPAGARLTALPMAYGVRLERLHDDVQPDGVLDRARLNLAGLPLELSAYAQILATLGVGGYRDELLGEAGAIDYGDDHYTCFQFDYDWRRDNAENARRLHQFILDKRVEVRRDLQQRYGVVDAEVKFDIVAHSMGGLVSRYYLRYGDQPLPADGSLPPLTWAGAEHVERLIVIGTPSGGSVKALIQLINGVRFAPVLPRYEPAVLGTMPSIYQLLPRGASGAVRRGGLSGPPVTDYLDINVWEQMGWGLADPDQDRVLKVLLADIDDPMARRRVALDHLRKCLETARQFHAALDLPATPPAGTRLFLFAGDAVPTDAVVAVDPESGAVWTVQQAPGDGTVTRASALCDQRRDHEWQPGVNSPIQWANVTFLFTDHLGLTRDPAFSDNALFILLEDLR